MELRTLIVDDNASFLDAARTLLEAEGLTVVALASTGSQAVAFCAALRPDVALVDVTLADESGFTVAQRLADVDPLLPVILVSTHAEGDFVEMIADSPARGFIPKSQLSAEAVRRLLAASEETGTSASSDT